MNITTTRKKNGRDWWDSCAHTHSHIAGQCTHKDVTKRTKRASEDENYLEDHDESEEDPVPQLGDFPGIGKCRNHNEMISLAVVNY